MAQRSRHQLEPEIDESLAPPPRKTMPASAIMPISRDSPAKSTEVKKTSSSKLKINEAGARPLLLSKTNRNSKVVIGEAAIEAGVVIEPQLGDVARSRSRDRKESERPRRDSRDRERRRDSRDRDDRRRRSSRDRDDRRERSRSRSRSRDRRRSYRSRSRDRGDRERRHLSTLEEKEAWKQLQVKERELEAKAYLAAQKEAREKGLPVPGVSDRKRDEFPAPRLRDDDRIASPSRRKRDSSRDRDRDRERSHSC